jgi:hypothetical protein
MRSRRRLSFLNIALVIGVSWLPSLAQANWSASATSRIDEILVAQSTPGGAPTSPPVAPLKAPPLNVSPTSLPPPGASSEASNPVTGAPQIIVVPQLQSDKSSSTGSKAAWPVLVWPITILVLTLMFAHSARLGRLLHLAPTYIRKISGPGGVSLEINPEAAKEQKDSF